MENNRYSILAKFHEGHYFYLNFEDPKILDCLELVPSSQGLLALAQWPIYDDTQIEFFVELINGNIKYYHLKDRRTKVMKTINLDKTELDNN